MLRTSADLGSNSFNGARTLVGARAACGLCLHFPMSDIHAGEASGGFLLGFVCSARSAANYGMS